MKSLNDSNRTILFITYQLYFNNAKVTAMNGIIKCNENKCAWEQSPDSSTKLKIEIEIAIMRLCPVSNPLIPANILIAFVQNTASIPIYT